MHESEDQSVGSLMVCHFRCSCLGYGSPGGSPAWCTAHYAGDTPTRQLRNLIKWDTNGQSEGSSCKGYQLSAVPSHSDAPFLFSFPSFCVAGNQVWDTQLVGAPQAMQFDNAGMLYTSGLFVGTLDAALASGGTDGYVRKQQVNYNCRSE
jgi:hypothetical protein